MDGFVEALLGGESRIPAEDDWYAPLLGDWDFDYSEPGGRQLKGEWFFRRVLDGTAIEDIFICPSRATREIDPQPDGEYGVALRMYDPEKHRYDMTYACTKGTTRLTVRKMDGKIVCSVQDDSGNKWVFCEVGADTFHWQNVTENESGEWRVNCEVFARRKG